MRASVDPIRDITLDVLDVAPEQAAGLVDASAGRLASGIESNVDRLASTIEDLAEKAPVVTLEVGRRRRSRRPLVVLLLILGIGAVAFRAGPPTLDAAGWRPARPGAGTGTHAGTRRLMT